MLNLNELIKEKLLDPEFYPRVFKEAENFINFDNYQAKILAEKLDEELALSSGTRLSDIEKKYQILISKLRFSALPFYTEKEIESFFEKEIFYALASEEFDIQDKLKAKMLDIVVTERDNFKRILSNALIRNKQIIAKAPSMVDNEKTPSTVSEWFKDYIQNVGTGVLDRLKQSQYFTNSPNFRNLSEDNKKKLKQLFNLYEWLKLSSLTPEGYEETITFVGKDGDLYSLESGQIVNLSKSLKPSSISHVSVDTTPTRPAITQRKAVPLPPYDALNQLYQTYHQQEANFRSLETEVLSKTSGQLIQIKQELVNALKLKDKNKTIAILRILARQGVLANILKETPSWHEGMIRYLKIKYAKLVPEAEVNKMAGNFGDIVNTPEVLSEFLQYILKEKINLSESESALVGLDLSETLAKRGEEKLNQMILGNQETGQFEWVKNKVENGQLVSEL